MKFALSWYRKIVRQGFIQSHYFGATEGEPWGMNQCGSPSILLYL